MNPDTAALATLAGVSAALAALLVLPPQSPRSRGRPATRPPSGPLGHLLVLRLAGSAGIAMVVVLFIGGTWGLALGVLGAGGCWWAAGRMEPPATRRRRERLAASVPHAVDLLAACLAAGLSPASALELVTTAVQPPLADELAAICARLRLGVDPAAVWRDVATHPQLGSLGRTLSRAVESGASVADALARLSEDLRRRSRAEVESRARSVGVKAALPLGGCLLPAFVLVGVVPLVAGSVSVLLH